MMKYWAHSDRDNLPETHPLARWQPLNEHLRQVGAIAGAFAKKAKPSDPGFHATAKAVGLLHDLGKYTEEFQQKIRGKVIQAPHSAYGAGIARRAKAVEAAFAISGHHAGLPNPQGGRASLKERTREVDGMLDDLWRIAVSDCPDLSECGELLRASTADLK